MVPLTTCSSRRSSTVFFAFQCHRGLRDFLSWPTKTGGIGIGNSHHGLRDLPSGVVRTISLFIRSSARETSSVTCSILRFLTISLILGRGPRSLRAMASLRATALPITFRLAPHWRQYCKPGEDSVAHCGQYMDGHQQEHIIVTVSDSQSDSALSGLRTKIWFSQL